jgi:hypothetical protein
MKRDDIRLGLRVINYRGSTIIAFAVNDKNEAVSIVGIYYGGQDFESMLVQDQKVLRFRYRLSLPRDDICHELARHACFDYGSIYASFNFTNAATFRA